MADALQTREPPGLVLEMCLRERVVVNAVNKIEDIDAHQRRLIEPDPLGAFPLVPSRASLQNWFWSFAERSEERSEAS